ncbi:MAG: hypothetical protein ABF727_09810 [Gluconobacter oxydans]
MNATHCAWDTDLKAAAEQRRAARNAVMRDYQPPLLSPEEARLELERLEAKLREKEAFPAVTQSQIAD